MSKIPFNLNQRPSGFKLHCSQPSITFSAEGGAVLCTITTDTDDAKIYYLVNSFQSPNIEDNLYDGPFEVNLGDKVSAIVIKDGFLDSIVAVQTYIPSNELYVPPTIDGDANPVLSEGVYHAYYVVRNQTHSRTAKLYKGDVEIEGGAAVSHALSTITEQTIEAVPELAAYIGWKYDVVTVNAEGLSGGGYSIEYAADGLSDDSLTFEVEDTPDYLCFTAEEEGAKLSFIGLRTSDKTFNLPDLKYSTDKKNWTALTYTEGEEDEDGNIPFSSQILTLGLGEKVYFKGINQGGVNHIDLEKGIQCLFDISNGKIAASGDIGTLIDEVGGENVGLSDYAFGMGDVGLFAMCTDLTQSPSLPATTLATDCYAGMFNGCISLTSAPTLPATTLAENCYGHMFEGCTSLITAPALPATTLANSCYSGMFIDCTSLTTAAALPATTLADSCYEYMFRGCTSLTEAPALPATTLAKYCYESMFNECTALTAAPALPAITLVDDCYYSMFYGCTFAMSDDGTTFNFQFGATLPQALSEGTLSTHKDVADWMDNITGFAN